MSKLPHKLALVFTCVLAACAGPGVHKVTYYPSGFDPAKDPYWEDPRFAKSLLDAVQPAVHAPADAGDMSTPGLHGAVKFTYVGGVIEYPDIAESTGNPDMDKLMLHQVASVQPPKATGPYADEPHEFLMELDMPTPFESFRSGIYTAINSQKVYPKDAILRGGMGDVTVSFDYLDGKAGNIVMDVARSSKSKDLDKASMDAVTRAVMPSAPPAYAGKTLHMEALFCYSLRGSAAAKDPCPTGSNVIEVTGTRIMRVDIERMP